VALVRAAFRGDGDLLSLLPAEAYRIKAGYIGYRVMYSTTQPVRANPTFDHPMAVSGTIWISSNTATARRVIVFTHGTILHPMSALW